MHHYRTRFQVKKQREAQEQVCAAHLRKLITEKAEARRSHLQSEEPVLEHHVCPQPTLLDAEEEKQKTLNAEEEKKNDVKFIQSRLEMAPRADSALERTEICIEIFDYLVDRPLLIKKYERFRNVVQQKIIEFQMTIQMERQLLKVRASNRTMDEWKQQAMILGMFDILEELIHRVKAHL